MPPTLLDEIQPNDTVVLYPSSCRYSDDFQDTPFDIILLNSNAFRQNRRIGKVICLNYDNNHLLGLLLSRGIMLSAIIIIRDGCQEGGNYECAAGEGFFGRLMPLMSERFDYICDHFSLPFNNLSYMNHIEGVPLDVPAEFENFSVPDYMRPFLQHSSPISQVKSFHIHLKTKIEKEITIGNIHVKVRRDSIWGHLKETKLNVIKTIGSSVQAVKYFISGTKIDKNKFYFVERTQLKTIKAILKIANDKKADTVSMVPFGNRKYSRIVKEIQGWENEFPKELNFFHLNESDYQDLKGL